MEFVPVDHVRGPERSSRTESWEQAAGSVVVRFSRPARRLRRFFTALGGDGAAGRVELGPGSRCATWSRVHPRRITLSTRRGTDDHHDRPKLLPTGTTLVPWHELASCDAVFLRRRCDAPCSRRPRVLVATARAGDAAQGAVEARRCGRSGRMTPSSTGPATSTRSRDCHHDVRRAGGWAQPGRPPPRRAVSYGGRLLRRGPASPSRPAGGRARVCTRCGAGALRGGGRSPSLRSNAEAIALQ
jgi:hypothetical protein